MAIELLKAGFVRTIATTGKPCGKHEDGGGLRLVVRGKGSASWVLRYERDGRRREMGLGALTSVPLAAARAIAAEHRLSLARGIDPLEIREQAARKRAAERAAAVTFRDAVEQFLAHRDKTSPNVRLNGYWRRTLETYALPVLGPMAVVDIERQHVLKVIEPLWTVKLETAQRVRMRIEAVLAAAAARGQRSHDNPAKWDALKPVLGTRKRNVRNHAALDWRALPQFLKALADDSSLAARALEFTILTACRSGEVLNARWDEIDGDLWSIPAARTKTRRPHKVPLSPEARSLLDRLHNIRRPPFIFFGQRNGRPLSGMAMLMLLRRLKRTDITVHGFRSTFRSWCADHGHDRELAEAALAHVAEGVEPIYQRSDMIERRRKLMSAWAAFCHGR
jgi:integrase